MSSDSRKINIITKDFKFKIDFTTDFNLLNQKITSKLEELYNKNFSNETNLYQLYYFDDEKYKNYIKNKNDFNFFANDPADDLFVDINEFAINQINEAKDKPEIIEGSLKPENQLFLFEKIEKLSKQNLELTKEREIAKEKNQIYLEKIKILEEDRKLKEEKEKSILQCLDQEKKEKKEIIAELEESKKLNESMSLTINNISTIANDDDSPKDILVNNLKEEKALLANQLIEERKKINLIENLYGEENQMLQEKLKKLSTDFDLQKKDMIEKNNLIIKNEVEKGINDYINKSKLEFQNKENEINILKNGYENNMNKIREECYEEIGKIFSKLYEQKIKEMNDKLLNNSKIMCDEILTKNQNQFEEEEKKRNQVIDANIFNNAHNNFNIEPIYKCKTTHNGISCNYCKKCPIIGYRYKCMKCPKYNLCQACEKAVEHEHNFIRYATEEKND